MARHWFARVVGVATVVALATGCDAAPPNRQSDVDRLTGQIASMAGVTSASNRLEDSPAQGLVNFRVDVDVSNDLTSDQFAAIVARYLADLRTGAYREYRAELDARHGWSVFAIDGGDKPIDNVDQVIRQARDWVALRREFPADTVSLRATIVHPSGQLDLREVGHSNVASIDMSDESDFVSVAEAAGVLSSRFPQLAGMDWTVSAGKDHPADLTTSHRYPTPAELDVWRTVNADQSIPHVDALRIGDPVTPPVWLSEKTTESHEVAVALRLAARHLPIVATLPAPVLYSASDQLSGHIGGRGMARGPVAVTIGGCTPRDPLVYEPIPEEQALIDRYAKCPR